MGTSSDAAAPIALVTRFLRLEDTVAGGGATAAGIPGDELSKLAMVGLLDATLWCPDVMAECRMDVCNTTVQSYNFTYTV